MHRRFILITAITAFVAVICLLLALYFYNNYHTFIDDTNYQISTYDNAEYKVRRDSSEAANYLAVLSSKIDQLVNYMYTNKIPDQEVSSRLYERWRGCHIRETSSYDTSVAFTLNKGSELRVCIRRPDGSFENMNTATFVLIHELAHLMSIEFGHQDEFRENFYIITNEAVKLDIYIPVDYSINPVTYCGSSIYSTPCSHNRCSSS